MDAELMQIQITMLENENRTLLKERGTLVQELARARFQVKALTKALNEAGGYTAKLLPMARSEDDKRLEQTL